MATKEESEKSALYSELKKQCNRQDYTRTHEVSNEILRRFPNETRAFQCKIVSLVHLEKYEECLRQLKVNKADKDNLLIKAYCEYRLNRIPEAHQTLQAADPNDVGVKELKGQVLYRMENYEESYNWYRDLLKGVDDDYGIERQANMAAVVAMLQVTGSSKTPKHKFSESTHELKHNVTCGLVAQSRFEESLKKLNEAEELCRETLGEDADISEEELNGELAPILIQKAYVLHSMGRLSEASEIYHAVTKQRPNDPAVMAVAANNIVCLNRDQNVFDSKKRLKVATADSLRHKMYSAQRNAIAANHALLLLHTNQSEACRRMASQLSEKQKGQARPILIAAAQYVRDRQLPKAAEFLEENLTNVSSTYAEEEVIQLRLALAQIYLQQEKVSTCCAQLSYLEPNRRHGVLGTMVGLYQGEQDVSAAGDLLRTAVQSSPKVEINILEAAADFYLRHDLFKQAAELYEKLYQIRPNDKRVLSCLMHAYSHFDKKKAELVSRDLNLDDDDSGIDVDALETTFIYGHKHIKKTLVDKTPKTPPTNEEMLLKKRRHKKKKNKPPKNIDPSVPLDPERWIPRRERSYYRPRKKEKRRDNISRGPQGQTDGGANLDINASPKPSSGAAGAEGQSDASKKQSRPSQPPKSSAKAKGRKKKR